MGGYFLEFNNFIPADPLKTPEHIAPVWYFTPFYSILRATTTEFMYVVAAGIAALTLLYWRDYRGIWKMVVPAVAVVAIALCFLMEAKVWGVVFMGLSVLIFMAMPWLDLSPAKSIRYKGPIYKIALTVFAIVFVVLGYLGVKPPTDVLTRVAQVGTVLYFAFFLLMPWYSRIDKTKPVPERVTYAH
jgi:ubiquinol-cytochrome c reductase cytochrome b subunit